MVSTRAQKARASSKSLRFLRDAMSRAGKSPKPPAGRAHGKAAAAGGGRGDAARLHEEIARLKVLNSAVEAERDFCLGCIRDIQDVLRT